LVLLLLLLGGLLLGGPVLRRLRVLLVVVVVGFLVVLDLHFGWRAMLGKLALHLGEGRSAMAGGHAGHLRLGGEPHEGFGVVVGGAVGGHSSALEVLILLNLWRLLIPLVLILLVFVVEIHLHLSWIIYLQRHQIALVLVVVLLRLEAGI